MADKLTRDEVADALEKALSGQGTSKLTAVVKRTDTSRFFRDGVRMRLEQEDGTRLYVTVEGSNNV